MSSLENINNNLDKNFDELVANLQAMANAGKKPAELLRYLVVDLGIEQQLELMKLFSEAFNVTLGEVTAISGWWHDETAELNDNDINHYIGEIVGAYRV